MEAETAGVYLIGAGSVAIAVALIFGRPTAEEAFRVEGPFSTRSPRLWFALECTGGVLAAVGALIIAIENPPSWWLLLGILPAYLCFHLVLAWKLWQYWHQEVKARRREVREVKDTPESRRLLEVSEKRGWKWCFVHAYSQETIADV